MNPWLQLRPSFRINRRVFMLYRLRIHLQRRRSTAGLQVLDSRQVLRLQLVAMPWLFGVTMISRISIEMDDYLFNLIATIWLGVNFGKWIRWALDRRGP